MADENNNDRARKLWEMVKKAFSEAATYEGYQQEPESAHEAPVERWSKGAKRSFDLK